MDYLDVVAAADGSLLCRVPETTRDSWHIVVVPASAGRKLPACLRMQASGDDARLENEVYLRDLPGGLGRVAVVYLRLDIEFLHFDLFERNVPKPAQIKLLRISRGAAALLLMAWHPLRFWRALRGAAGGWGDRSRAALYEVATRGSAPPSYAQWVDLFDRWEGPARARLLDSPRRSNWPRLSVVVFHAGKEGDGALAATLDGLKEQWVAVPHGIVAGTGDAARRALATALRDADSDYVVLVQAGERLAPHALALLGDEIARLDRPDAIFADEDGITRDGRRHGPLFKPEASHTLMLSGSLTRGIWAFRREHLEDEATAGSVWAETVWAETVRLETWLRLRERDPGLRTSRLPFVLTHRLSDAEAAPAMALADVVRQHLDRTALPARFEDRSFPLHVQFAMPRDGQAKVSIIIPTAARLPHVTQCLSGVLARTDYAAFELVIVVSQATPLTAEQEGILAPVLGDPRVRLVRLETASFNYSQANNYGASLSDGEFLCLLNDDVEPMRADWLAGMVGHLADPAAGIVGAKLFYRDRTIQHAGVVMGLGGVAEHVHRHLPYRKAGYGGRARLSQEFSAVTGACLLVRRSAFEAVGGLDEAYPIAFNDLDFCLKVRERGWSVIYSAETEMWHYESASLGHHFSGERAAAELMETDRMLARWHEVCAADPYHNPNLSLRRGNEWDLAFPPRITRP
jgi:O-antigen biosynthesis protein